MNVRDRKQKLVAEINITPFTDVILVLLIIFMVATPLIMQSSIKIKLPTAASAKPMENIRNQAIITITNESTVFLDDELVTRKELRKKMTMLSRENPNLAVILRSDKLVRFEDVVSVLDIFNELGIKNLNITATNE